MGESHRAVLDKPITCGESPPPHTHTLLKRNDSGCASLRQVAVTGISGGKRGSMTSQHRRSGDAEVRRFAVDRAGHGLRLSRRT